MISALSQGDAQGQALHAMLKSCALEMAELARPPRFGLLEDGKRLHLQDGPIDLIIEADGLLPAILSAYRAAIRRFAGLLDELCEELAELRKPAAHGENSLGGAIARNMHEAVSRLPGIGFITPMAAVAGAVADEILARMLQATAQQSGLRRAMVNNGGDIAFWLHDGETLSLGLVDRPETGKVFAKASIGWNDHVRGIATSGFGGRSFTLGIADAVTVFADTAAQADAAATAIANAVDLPGHQAVQRQSANLIQPDSDLGALAVTRNVGPLTDSEIETALANGAWLAERLIKSVGLRAVCLHLRGRTITCGQQGLLATRRETQNA